MIKKKPPIDGELGDGPNHHCFGEKNPDYPHDQVERGGHSVHLHLGGAGGPGFGLPVRLMHQALPPPSPHGMGPIYWPHMRSSPSPPCGVVGVWYGMLGMYGVYGRSGMACLESMVCLVCMVCMA